MLGLPPEQVFKTLLADIDGSLVVAIVPVAGKLDLKALAAAVGGKKAAMADPTSPSAPPATSSAGSARSGRRRRLRDRPRRDGAPHDTVYVSGGRRGFDLGLSPDDLISKTSAITADIARD